MTSEASAALSPAARERRFYGRMAWFIIVLVFLGFAPSFYLKPLGLSYPRPNPPLITHLMVHGFLFTAWVGMFFAQVRLVAAGRRDLHRTIGMFAMVYGLALIPFMYLTAVWGVAHNSTAPFSDPLTWTAISLVPLPVYIAVLWLGWRESRRDLQAHKRIMLGLLLMFTEPAFSRLPLAPPTWLGFTAQMVANLLVFAPLIIWDLRTRGSVHWATKAVIGAFVVIITGQAFFLGTPGVWASFAARLPGVGS